MASQGEGLGDLEMMFNWLSSVQGLIATAQNNLENEKNRAAAMAELKKMEEEWKKLDPQLQEMLAEQLQQSTQLANIQEDPRLKQYQMRALDELGDIVQAGGKGTAEDALAYDTARQNAASTDMALRGAAESQASARGLGAAGRFMGALQGAQAGANRMSQEGLQAAADNRKRYLQALNEMGNQAGQVRGQEYNMAANEANAQDAINRFNTGQKWNSATARANAKLSTAQGQNDIFKTMYQAILADGSLSEKDRMAQLAALNNFMAQSGANAQRGVNQVFNGMTGNWGQMISTASGDGGSGGGGGGGMGMLSGMMGGGGSGGGMGGFGGLF